MSAQLPSKEIMELDLRNTKNELDAYCHLIDGYKILNNLPETRGQYRMQLARWEGAKDGCKNFLDRLQNLYDENYGKELKCQNQNTK